MATIKRRAQEKKWEDPINPEGPVDSRDEEQMHRQQQEAQIRKENLTGNEKDNQKAKKK